MDLTWSSSFYDEKETFCFSLQDIFFRRGQFVTSHKKLLPPRIWNPGPGSSSTINLRPADLWYWQSFLLMIQTLWGVFSQSMYSIKNNKISSVVVEFFQIMCKCCPDIVTYDSVTNKVKRQFLANCPHEYIPKHYKMIPRWWEYWIQNVSDECSKEVFVSLEGRAFDDQSSYGSIYKFVENGTFSHWRKNSLGFFTTWGLSLKSVRKY